ncbi:hypothetical protein D8B26_003797 [Coccidioides posadasii str. Silveira]|uniref:Uncharacterized protein n=1 Tax=Coccidioides posadasii (strain RMSCC 757 / Silveira) TaxID=443226 RepID=E9D8X7_COCPS|nr:conserved hypothetical protein [Coccidioides posadasii str. Silveira]QVM09131.1 hypothetical protein D8B26_003797 [Coccidioides posadasii str. Silveira]
MAPAVKRDLTDRDATVEVDDFNAKSFKPRSFDESDLDRLNIRLLPLDVAQPDQLQPCFYAPVPESELPQAPWTDMGLVTASRLLGGEIQVAYWNINAMERIMTGSWMTRSRPHPRNTHIAKSKYNTTQSLKIRRQEPRSSPSSPSFDGGRVCGNTSTMKYFLYVCPAFLLSLLHV